MRRLYELSSKGGKQQSWPEATIKSVVFCIIVEPCCLTLQDPVVLQVQPNLLAIVVLSRLQAALQHWLCGVIHPVSKDSEDRAVYPASYE